MNLQNQRNRRSTETSASADDPTGEGAGSMMQQALRHGGAARQAAERCEKGAAAAQELNRRANRPGQ